ncbi:Fic family protein [Candidatus Thiodictyon syntrophicum]|jgi:Fic family protein|uniref:Cell filamentation protein Fic n=1 Tax=Candidatus Thiodictyon syntrophicum TaxID=1166950 RepID=A0A2K8U9Q8_9GAMM|nr:Fic family protein [Candidatus Thiodictyon syntrophicum]AUB82295.1 cell filamentation protein Fic [Candidatus Thiodictyon syntrophicum]
MNTLRRFCASDTTVPAGTSWYLADLGEARGQQALFTRQSPQRLKALREHALIESAVSSNRIEGVTVEHGRVRELILGQPLLRDRDEEEVRGYRDALTLIHEGAAGLDLSDATIRKLHRLTRGEIWDAGKYKEKDVDIIERYPDGDERIRFRTVPAAETLGAMSELLADWQCCLDERWIHPLIALAAFNLDFLCIHPFRDGNGRVSRLLLLLQSYQLGYEVGRYISLERLIEQNKARYYETLEQSSQGWHAGKHDSWPYINYLFYILKTAYREFSEQLGEIKSPRGAKTDQVVMAIRGLSVEFTLSQLEHACPGVSRDMIRRVLRDQQAAGVIACRGRGPAARWQKKG